MTLDIVCPSTGRHEEAVASWITTTTEPREFQPMVLAATTGDEAGFLSKLQQGYESSRADVIAFFHSDLIIHEKGWDSWLLREFKDESVAVAGFCGAKRLGHEDLYRVPYRLEQLARAGVRSNLSDAEAHGARSAGACDVAVLDSMAIVVRRAFLQQIGGWRACELPNNPHCTDLWICAMAARYRRRVRFLGVSCTHRSGGKGSVGTNWLDERGGDAQMHRDAHARIYDTCRDVLPIVVR